MSYLLRKELKMFLRKLLLWWYSGFLTVASNDTVSDLINRGRYDRLDKEVLKHFSSYLPAVGKYQFKLVETDKTTSIFEELIKIEHGGGWVLGKLEHLLLLGAGFPNIQKLGSVAALGSGYMVGSLVRVPNLTYHCGYYGDDKPIGIRHLVMNHSDYGYVSVDILLLVRKVD